MSEEMDKIIERVKKITDGKSREELINIITEYECEIQHMEQMSKDMFKNMYTEKQVKELRQEAWELGKYS